MFLYSPGILAHVPTGPYSFRIDRNPFFFLPPPSNTLLILVIPIIRSRSILHLVRHTISPSGIPHTFELLPLTPSIPKPTLLPPSFHNQPAQDLSIFLAILFLQFYCTTVLFIPHPQTVRCSHIVATAKPLSLASTILVLPVTLSSCCLSGIQESA